MYSTSTIQNILYIEGTIVSYLLCSLYSISYSSYRLVYHDIFLHCLRGSKGGLVFSIRVSSSRRSLNIYKHEEYTAFSARSSFFTCLKVFTYRPLYTNYKLNHVTGDQYTFGPATAQRLINATDFANLIGWQKFANPLTLEPLVAKYFFLMKLSTDTVMLEEDNSNTPNSIVECSL